MKELNQQTEFSIFCASCIMAVALIFFTIFIYIPQLREEKGEIETMLAETKEKINKAEAYRQAHADYKKYEAGIRKKNRLIEERLPKKLMTAKFVEEVQSMAVKENIEIIRLEPGPVSPYESYSSQRIDMSIHGSFYQMLYFLRDMENSRLFMHVEKVSISNKLEKLDCKLGIRIFSEAG